MCMLTLERQHIAISTGLYLLGLVQWTCSCFWWMVNWTYLRQTFLWMMSTNQQGQWQWCTKKATCNSQKTPEEELCEALWQPACKRKSWYILPYTMKTGLGSATSIWGTQVVDCSCVNVKTAMSSDLNLQNQNDMLKYCWMLEGIGL